MKITIARWNLISPRERGLLLVCGGLLLVWLLNIMLWQPLQQQREQWLRTIAREQNTVEWMLKQAPLLQQAESQTSPAVPVSLTAAATQSATSLGVKVVRLQPQGNRLSVTLEPIAFDRLMRWLAQVEQLSGGRVTALDVSRQADLRGWVTVKTLTLEQDNGR